MPSKTPFTTTAVRRVLEQERADLFETWTAEGTLQAHLQRLVTNAEWVLHRWETSNANWISTLKEANRLEAAALLDVIALAVPDDLDRVNTFDRDPDAEPLDATQLRSGWFSISTNSDATQPPTS